MALKLTTQLSRVGLVEGILQKAIDTDSKATTPASVRIVRDSCNEVWERFQREHEAISNVYYLDFLSSEYVTGDLYSKSFTVRNLANELLTVL